MGRVIIGVAATQDGKNPICCEKQLFTGEIYRKPKRTAIADKDAGGWPHRRASPTSESPATGTGLLKAVKVCGFVNRE
jgi:hypothetical protein